MNEVVYLWITYVASNIVLVDQSLDWFLSFAEQWAVPKYCLLNELSPVSFA